jgi:hypothetical protein
MICEVPNRVIIPPHAGDGRTAVGLAGVAGEIATPAAGWEPRSPPSGEHSAPEAPWRMRLSNADRLPFVWLYRLCPAVMDAVAIIRPETLFRWHRRGFKVFWRWKSRSRRGRPAIPWEIRETGRRHRAVAGVLSNKRQSSTCPFGSNGPRATAGSSDPAPSLRVL